MSYFLKIQVSVFNPNSGLEIKKTRISIAYCFSIYDKAVSILRLVTNLVKFKTFNNLPKI
ncbi:MAG: hypothetical protein WBIAU1_11450 [Wolbachia endosymbiont of Drosophila biauraria]|nr:MAG: hypothetical protein WBIAU1_11450 [Wolbachia endosymbiont of Drosophila biauraria]BEP32804.1 MAG: hypothetical protein WBIAU2_10310 [Wolbachia endosymbiont of Drosophila biauraria]